MPSLTFKREFADAITSGEKNGSIRPRRAWTGFRDVGRPLTLYAGKRLLGRTVITRTRPISLFVGGMNIGAQEFLPSEADAFAKANGFDCYFDLVDFVLGMYGQPTDGDPFCGWLIEWKPLTNGGRPAS